MLLNIALATALWLFFPLVLSQTPHLTLNDPPSTSPNLTDEGRIFCASRTYGHNLQASSCMNAWTKIPRASAETVFGSRGQPGIDAGLPLRYQSDDGLCVIEMRARQKYRSVEGDVTTGVAISDAAKRVIDKCVVLAQVASGGSTTGFSVFLLFRFFHELMSYLVGSCY